MNPIESDIRYAIRLSSFVRDAQRMVANGWILQVAPRGVSGKIGPAFQRVA